MTFINITLLVMAAAAPVLIWWVVFFQVPAIMHSLYRNELWAVRDALVDDILSGKIERTEISVDLVQGIEMLIATSKRQTLVEFATMYWALRDVHLHSPRNPLDPDTYLGSEVQVRDRTALLGYSKHVQDAVFRHLERGSLFGLVGWTLAALPWSRPRFKKVAREAYRNEVNILPTAVRHRMRVATVA